MSVILTSLEALILKATHESLPCPDAAALEAFCAVMKDSAEGPQFAAQALANRIHTPNAREAMLTLGMVDRCMRRCDGVFHAEIGKFRFLNEMIKLVSPKYFAERTAPEVQKRVFQLLHAWSIEFPKESKFKVAYDMLKNQGVIKETPPPLPPEDAPAPRSRAQSAIFEDEEKSKLLQKLLQSKKPEDLQHANRLIKTMVREEERRTEASSRRAQEVGAALDSAGLLRDMLGAAGAASPDERQLIHELHAACARLRPALLRAGRDQDHLDDILHASDLLDEVMEQYSAFVAEQRPRPAPRLDKRVSNADSLLDFAGLGDAENTDAAKEGEVASNVIDELGEIFAAERAESAAAPLRPLGLLARGDVDLLGERSDKKEGWNELDSLGEQLLKQSLPENAVRRESFVSKPVKIPMNALEKSPKRDSQTSSNGAIFDLDFFTKDTKEQISSNNTPRHSISIPRPSITSITSPRPSIYSITSPRPSIVPRSSITTNDDMILDINIESLENKSNKLVNNNEIDNLDSLLTVEVPDNIRNEVTEENNKEIECKEMINDTDSVKPSKNEVKPLTDINVTLESVKPSRISPLTVFEEEGGLTVVLHFCKDKPREDVNVIVISTTSKNSLPIEDFKFQSVVPKGCKVRLLTPSGTSLPAYNPFLPPPALTQVMLLARPSSAPDVHLKFVLTYTCDEETCSEMGEVQKLPLEDI